LPPLPRTGKSGCFSREGAFLFFQAVKELFSTPNWVFLLYDPGPWLVPFSSSKCFFWGRFSDFQYFSSAPLFPTPFLWEAFSSPSFLFGCASLFFFFRTNLPCGSLLWPTAGTLKHPLFSQVLRFFCVCLPPPKHRFEPHLVVPFTSPILNLFCFFRDLLSPGLSDGDHPPPATPSPRAVLL